MKKESKEFIQPRYNSFYEKYAGLPFSKHPQTYLKFKPEDVLSHIDSFFDAAAWNEKNKNKENFDQISSIIWFVADWYKFKSLVI